MKFVNCTISLAVTAALLISAAISPAPVRAAVGTMTLGTDIGAIGQEITISGSGFDDGTVQNPYYINVIFGNNPGSSINYATELHQIVRQEPISADGTFSTTFIIPDMIDTTGPGFETVRSGTYFIFLTYHQPVSGTNTVNVLNILDFRVLGGNITMTPETGPVGTEISLSGTGFTSSEQLTVRCDDVVLTVMGTGKAGPSGSFTNLRAYISQRPAGPHAIVITGQSSGYQAGKMFNVEPAIVTKPTEGVASSSITIGGNGFAAESSIDVTFDNVSIFTGTTDRNGSFFNKFPPNTFAQGSHTIAVTDTAGNHARLTYGIFDASITLEPSTGSPGWEAAISGAGFLPDDSVTISFENIASKYDLSATTDEEGNFSTVFAVPWGDMGTYDITVTDGKNEKTAQFEVDTSDKINPITNSSSPGTVGDEITVSGNGFIANRTVIITFSGTQVATGTVLADGTFSVSFSAPSTIAGHHIIEASDGNNTIRYGFVLEGTPPPKPDTLLPEPGARASAETEFDWDDVTDPSGVTYTLQVATDPLFSSNYILLEETGIVTSGYTVPEQSRLNAVTEEAPYYWRVRAVDRAMNPGEWSDTGTFHVGFGTSLPQTVIYIIIVAVALLLAAFTFWLGRKTAFY